MRLHEGRKLLTPFEETIMKAIEFVVGGRRRFRGCTGAENVFEDLGELEGKVRDFIGVCGGFVSRVCGPWFRFEGREKGKFRDADHGGGK